MQKNFEAVEPETNKICLLWKACASLFKLLLVSKLPHVMGLTYTKKDPLSARLFINKRLNVSARYLLSRSIPLKFR
ncbi:hypothetical protein F511_43139 [Dorcoceras hygrometricum]|uniref:Uncharacterized protein n=1 Tax=Dorcoceras hygrometricum TaxID=472368 RepID=A0A2Z6ZYX1_9LAMI|nr:hypothetical protein F511_44598 [Dorcoceras hygrometricum]KZV14437.1 hypothetical protein F511_43139 [Dorcoceras hygrometricum]